MWNRITDIIKTTTCMLQSGEIPPKTPPEHRADLSKINFLASKKFYVVFWSIIILSLFYAASVCILFLTSSFPDIIIPFVSIFTETIKILAVIIASYLGVQTVLDYKMYSSSNVETKRTEEEIEEETVLTSNAKEQDYEV